jgi:tetratricopeptide (TPR) repeat protein
MIAVSEPPAALLALGHTLAGEGRLAEAATVFDSLAAQWPQHHEVLRGRMRLLGAQGRTLEALSALAQLRATATDLQALLADVREQSAPAIAAFNTHLAAGEMAQAEAYAALLVQLIPNGAPMVTAAMSCNQALGRVEAAGEYAATLLTLEPENLAARQAVAAACKLRGDLEGEARHRLVAALSPANVMPPLLRLRDLHDIAGEILCRPLTPQSSAQLEVALAAAKVLTVAVEPGSEWEAWSHHYGLLVKGLDMAAVAAPTPVAAPEPELAWASAAGQPMDAAGVQSLATRLGAQAIFFAAADEAYVDLYARWYALSVLKYADVPCLVVIHVIGGKQALGRIARSVGVSDERVVFAGDDFDAATVTTACWDAPPKGRIEKPVAHLQSVRFQRLGGLLEMLGRPVFVSDIDLILQRGVADLLARCAACDVVFNENEVTTHAGSRLTANLMLVQPTQNAQVLLRFLRSYLDRVLAAPAVSRWIDQVALVVGRHHLQTHAPAAQIGYFDTTSDINNVMYPSYQANPFRFLSLFHGFDTSTLEDQSAVLGEGKAA